MATPLTRRGFCAFHVPRTLPYRVPRQPAHRRLHTETRSPTDDFLPPRIDRQTERKELESSEGDGPFLPPCIAEHQLNLHSQVDIIRESLRNDTSVLVWRNDLRIAVDRSVQEYEQERLQLDSLDTSAINYDAFYNSSAGNAQFPINGEPLPHDTFRKEVYVRAVRGSKPIRRILREQLLRCQWPRDVLRVLAVGMQKKETAREMVHMSESFTRALYRSRNNVSDAKILTTANVIVGRLKRADIVPPLILLDTGLKFAARARSLSGMKRYLKEYHERGLAIPGSVFRSVIAKFSIGARGLGEIRNGRWRRDELLQVLLGFEDAEPGKEYHLQTFLVRESWQYLHGWITVLSRCKATDELWNEWLLWLESPARLHPRALQSAKKNATTKSRGDYWFIASMCYSGDMERVWAMLEVTGIPFSALRPTEKIMLLDRPELVTTWTEDIKSTMMDKYVLELEKIERAFGAQWVSSGDGKGKHVFEKSLEKSIEEQELDDPEYLTKPVYGYPWDAYTEDEAARELNEAEEVVTDSAESVSAEDKLRSNDEETKTRTTNEP